MIVLFWPWLALSGGFLLGWISCGIIRSGHERERAAITSLDQPRSIPLARAMICLTCDALFALDGGMTCPGCGSEGFVPLQTWIGSGKGGRAR